MPANTKMVVGNHIPDFVVFAIKTDATSGVAIEIDGDSHVDKAEKDLLRNNHLGDQKLFTWEIQNDQVTDFKFITKSLLTMYRLRNGSLNQQILRTKRSIWTKTIACHLALSEIEEFIAKRFDIRLNLNTELIHVATRKDCPRSIRQECRRQNTATPSIRLT